MVNFHVSSKTVLALLLLAFLFFQCKEAPIPFILQIEPNPAQGGTFATIEGNHLLYYDELLINGESHPVTPISNQQLKFFVPVVNEIKELSVCLTYDGGKTETFGLLVFPCPRIDSLSRSIASVGDTISIFGQNFTDGSFEIIPNNNEAQAINAFPVDTTQLNFIIPGFLEPATLDTIRNDVRLRVRSETCSIDTTLLLDVRKTRKGPPVIQDIFPNLVRVGDPILIRGTNLLGENNSPEIVFTPNITTTDTSITMSSDTALTIIIPPRVKSGRVKVITDIEEATSEEEIILAPKLNEISPERGKPGENTLLTLNGWNFEGLQKISWGNEDSQQINDFSQAQLISETSVVIDFPPQEVGRYNISLTTETGISDTLSFIVANDANCDQEKPNLISAANISNEVNVSPGETIFLKGEYFDRNPVVVLDNRIRITIEEDNFKPDEITFKLPLELDCRTYPIYVVTDCDSTASKNIFINKQPTLISVDTDNERIYLTGNQLEGTSILLNDQVISSQYTVGGIAIDKSMRDGFVVVDGQECGSDSIYLTLPLFVDQEDNICIQSDDDALIVITGNISKTKALTLTLNSNGNQIPLNYAFAPNDSNRISFTPPNDFTGIGNISLSDGENSTDLPISVFQAPDIELLFPKKRYQGGGVILWGKNLKDIAQIKLGSDITIRRGQSQPDYNNNLFVGNITERYEQIGFYVPKDTEPNQYSLEFTVNQGGCEFSFNPAEALEVTNEVFSGLPGIDFPPLLLANPPAGFSLPFINNQWRLLKYDPLAWGTDKEICFLDKETNLDNIYFVLNDNVPDTNCDTTTYPVFIENSTISGNGDYKKDGTFIRINYNGQNYFGRTDSIYPTNPFENNIDCSTDYAYPLRVILTPEEAGDQLEMIYPYVIDNVKVTHQGANINNIEILGRYFHESELDVYSEEIVRIYDSNGAIVNTTEYAVSDFSINANGTILQFNLKNLTSGSYFLALLDASDARLGYSNVKPISIQ